MLTFVKILLSFGGGDGKLILSLVDSTVRSILSLSVNDPLYVAASATSFFVSTFVSPRYNWAASTLTALASDAGAASIVHTPFVFKQWERDRMCRQNLAEEERERGRKKGEVVQIVVLSTTDNYLHRVERKRTENVS